MSEFYDSVDNNKLYFEYVGPTKGVRFYEYMGSKQLFNKLKDNRIRFSDALKKQELLKKINEVKIGHKNTEQEKVVKNLEGFYKSRENVFNFFQFLIVLKCSLMLVRKQNNETEQGGTGLKILTPKQMLQRLPIALSQVKGGKNSKIY